MNHKCWFCNADLQTEGMLIQRCSYCGVEVDFTLYNPIKEEDVKPETKKGESSFAPWLVSKVSPILLEKGLEIVVTNEWSPSENPKITHFLYGECEVNGEKYTHGINATSYYSIMKIHGQDTADWVGKTLIYQGKVKMGNKGATGHLWSAKG